MPKASIISNFMTKYSPKYYFFNFSVDGTNDFCARISRQLNFVQSQPLPKTDFDKNTCTLANIDLKLVETSATYFAAK